MERGFSEQGLEPVVSAREQRLKEIDQEVERIFTEPVLTTDAETPEEIMDEHVQRFFFSVDAKTLTPEERTDIERFLRFAARRIAAHSKELYRGRPYPTHLFGHDAMHVFVALIDHREDNSVVPMFLHPDIDIESDPAATFEETLVTLFNEEERPLFSDKEQAQQAKDEKRNLFVELCKSDEPRSVLERSLKESPLPSERVSELYWRLANGFGFDTAAVQDDPAYFRYAHFILLETIRTLVARLGERGVNENILTKDFTFAQEHFNSEIETAIQNIYAGAKGDPKILVHEFQRIAHHVLDRMEKKEKGGDSDKESRVV